MRRRSIKRSNGLEAENITLTDVPEWIRSDIVQQVFSGSQLSTISLKDREACSSIAAAFRTHPWIERVLRVQKMAGAQVKVDVEYRRPFAGIYYEQPIASHSAETETVASSTQVTTKNSYYFIVDEHGVNLPWQDFAPEDVLKLFHIYCPGAKLPDGPVGSVYSDPRVLKALEICKLLEDMRVEFGIQAINVLLEYPEQPSTSGWVYKVVLKNDRVIEWGHAPGEEPPNEEKALEKLVKIRRQLGGVLVDTQPMN